MCVCACDGEGGGRGEREREREREGTNIICIISNRIKESARRNEIARICQTHLLSLLETYVATLTYPRTQTIKAFRKCRPCYRDIEMSIAIEISDSSNGNRTNRTSSMRTRTIEEQLQRSNAVGQEVPHSSPPPPGRGWQSMIDRGFTRALWIESHRLSREISIDEGRRGATEVMQVM